MGGKPLVIVTADPAGLKAAAAALDVYCATANIPRAVAWRLQLALDEVVSNIGRHAGPSHARVEMTPCVEAGMVHLTLSDDGPPFDPLALADPQTTGPLEARQPGGLGLMLLKRLIDDARYQRTDGRNVLVLTCRLSGTTPAAC